MLNFFFAFVTCLALFFSLSLGIFALFRSKSYKKNYFLLTQAMVVIYLLGHLLEITSTNAEEAYTAVKVLYIGFSFVATFAFFFIADYCNIRLHRGFVKIPMLIVSTLAALIMISTKFHHLVFIEYSFSTDLMHSLVFAPGPLFFLVHSYPVICLILTMVLLVCQIKKCDRNYRKRLYLFFVCVAIPFITEIIYFASIVAGINKYHIHFTPFSLAIMSFCLYLGVVRFNIFELISVATETAMEHIREGFLLVDKDDNYLFSNPATEKMLPEIKKLKKGESIFRAIGWPAAMDIIDNDMIEFSITDENSRHFRASVSPMFSDNKILIAKIILIREITESVNLMRKLENAAYIDALTGLYNRKHFSELANSDIGRALRLKQSVFTAMLDLDFFKTVNDTYGHAAGDLVLKTTAVVIRQTIRSYDLLCRYGGEEFVLLITDLETSEALNLMERIRENMEIVSTIYEGKEIKITCSIGLSEFHETDTLESSIKSSDEALYEAKNSGRNMVIMNGLKASK